MIHHRIAAAAHMLIILSKGTRIGETTPTKSDKTPSTKSDNITAKGVYIVGVSNTGRWMGRTDGYRYDGISSPNGPVRYAQADGETSFPAHSHEVQPMAKYRFRHIGMSPKSWFQSFGIGAYWTLSRLDVLAKFVG